MARLNHVSMPCGVGGGQCVTEGPSHEAVLKRKMCWMVKNERDGKMKEDPGT